MSLEEGASLTLITIMVGIATTVVATFTVYFRKKQYEVANKQIQLTALMEVFRLLNNEVHRKARQMVYKHHRDVLDGKDLAPDNDDQYELRMLGSYGYSMGSMPTSFRPGEALVGTAANRRDSSE